MMTIASFATPEDAHLFRAFLGAHDIDAAVFDENIAQWCWYYSQAIGGVRVVVGDSQAQQAANLYQEYMSSLRNGPHPVEPVRGWLPTLLLSILIGGPFLIFGRRRLKARFAATGTLPEK